MVGSTSTKDFKDVWFCLSLQSETKPNPRTPDKPRAKRLSANALAVKAIWIDVDVGKAGAYDTLGDALKAIIAFSENVGLPMPSAIVGSAAASMSTGSARPR